MKKQYLKGNNNMDRMKTFLIYFLLLVGFFFLSYILENGLIAGMYTPIKASINSSENNNQEIEIKVGDGTASNINGYINFKIKNNSDKEKELCFAKVDLYSKNGLLAATEYVEIKNLKPGEEREYNVKFKANEISRYEVSVVDTVPDKTNVINILGWEFDATNFLGIDLTKVFGEDIYNLFNIETMKSKGMSAWLWIKAFLESVPMWAYFIAGGIVLWYLPSGYLFGIFPQK